MVKNIEVCDRLARNIEMMRKDEEFFLLEKSSIADAFYGILSAKSELEDGQTSQMLDTAIDIVLSYMFYIDLFREV